MPLRAIDILFLCSSENGTPLRASASALTFGLFFLASDIFTRCSALIILPRPPKLM